MIMLVSLITYYRVMGLVEVTIWKKRAYIDVWSFFASKV